MGYTRLKPRKIPGNQDKVARAEFLRRVQILRAKPKINLWFCDETGFAGDPTPRQIMCLKGSRPVIPYYGSHVRASVVGAVKPRDGQFVSIVAPFVDTGVFQDFIGELAGNIDKKQRNIVVLDNAVWHKTKKLNWGLLEPMYLPTYSPDLNPIEELWLAIKREFFSWFWTKDETELDDHVELALKYYIDRPELVKSICAMSTFE